MRRKIMLSGTPPKCGLLLAGLLLVAAAESRPQRPAQEVTPVPEGSGEEQARVSHELYESGRIQFSAPPPTVVGAGVQCDHDGNIYLIYAASLQVIYPLLRAGVSLPVSKLSLDSKGVVQFPVGQFQGYAEYQRPSFFVDPLGKVEGLVVAYPHERGYKGPNWPDSLIVKYKDDGTVDSVVKLDPPLGEHFQPWSFAAFLDGNFLVTGAVLSDKYMPKQPFTAIFDRGGGFVRLLTLPHDVRPRVTEPPPLGGSSGPPPRAQAPADTGAERGEQEPARPWLLDIQQGLAAGSLDGNVYLLRASSPARLYVISPGGSVLRDLEVRPPEPGLQPLQMSLLGENGILLKFAARRSHGPQKRETLALLDLTVGKITGTYNTPADAGSLVSACATPRNELLFLGTTRDNHLEVVKFVPR